MKLGSSPGKAVLATGKTIENLIFDLNKEEGTTLVLVTHNLELASKTQKIIRIKAQIAFQRRKLIKF